MKKPYPWQKPGMAHLIRMVMTAQDDSGRPTRMYWQEEEMAEAAAMSLSGDMYPWPTRWKEMKGRHVRTMANPVWCWEGAS